MIHLIILGVSIILGVFGLITACRFSAWLGSAWDAHYVHERDYTPFKVFWWRNN